VNTSSAAGFSRAAKEYRQGRPPYPAQAVALLGERLCISAGRTVLDLAAGTGKLTALLAPLGADLIAVEPVDEMRASLAEALPDVRALAGSAEAIPLAEGSVDAVTVAQAFHWFDAARAAAEIHRVLRPGGGLGLIWNSYDARVEWVSRLAALAQARRPEGVPYYDGRPGLDAPGLFDAPQRSRFRHTHRVTREMLGARVASTSYIATLPDGERATLLSEVDALVAGHPAEIDLPYTTDVFLYRRL
jgi:SAM-dependent methyltransferase